MCIPLAAAATKKAQSPCQAAAHPPLELCPTHLAPVCIQAPRGRWLGCSLANVSRGRRAGRAPQHLQVAAEPGLGQQHHGNIAQDLPQISFLQRTGPPLLGTDTAGAALMLVSGCYSGAALSPPSPGTEESGLTLGQDLTCACLGLPCPATTSPWGSAWALSDGWSPGH